MSKLLGVIWIEDHLFYADGAAVPGEGAAATICWRHSRNPDESDAPGAFTVVLSEALVSLGSVVFIDRFLGCGDGTRRKRQTPGGSLFSLPLRRAWWKRGPNALDVMATRDAIILATLGFSEGGWDTENQVIALMNRTDALEDLEADALLSWLGARPRPNLEATFSHGIRLILVAGHDGEWASAIATDRDTLHAVRDALRAAADARGLRWIEGNSAELFRLGGYGEWPAMRSQ